ncbi:uncharacterized protein C16C10.8 [Topomyia yanbarensis]|uniref:uncharacterized protein C16C10.8 n=1 Tax=Topomyia yanbarensis TaxID=2498891 RepID=UPI00273CD6D4|nr:uncharacterized protein C16C10.8 [Topomyia yanbarensis]
MVFFTCNHCGETVKKRMVEKHGWKCKKEINVSCIDCLNDFVGKAYDAHTSCITEEEKYSGKDYVPKANANKGAKKQEAWLDTIRSITDRQRNLSNGVNDVFNIIRKNDNIPRKQKGFMNFFQNSAKHIRLNDVKAAWTLLEEEVKRVKENANSQQANGTVPSAAINQANGTSVVQENGCKKRKLENTEESTVLAQPACKKSKKKHNQQRNGHSEEHDNLVDVSVIESAVTLAEPGQGKFNWKEVIRTTLGAKNNEMKLSKLKKKVLKKYQQFVGSSIQVGDKIERKFSKKITKLGVVVDNETVRLID